jgi:hypothetical protein
LSCSLSPMVASSLPAMEVAFTSNKAWACKIWLRTLSLSFAFVEHEIGKGVPFALILVWLCSTMWTVSSYQHS